MNTSPMSEEVARHIMAMLKAAHLDNGSDIALNFRPNANYESYWEAIVWVNRGGVESFDAKGADPVSALINLRLAIRNHFHTKSEDARIAFNAVAHAGGWT